MMMMHPSFIIILVLIFTSAYGRPQLDPTNKQYTNCWGLVTNWADIIGFDPVNRTLALNLDAIESRTYACLQEQSIELSLSYKLTLNRKWEGEERRNLAEKSISVHQWLQTPHDIMFHFVLLR